MKVCQDSLVIVSISLAVILFSSAIFAADEDILFGLKGICVSIEPKDFRISDRPYGFEKDILNAKMIRNDIEKKLKLGRIKLLNDKECLEEKGKPVLIVHVYAENRSAIVNQAFYFFAINLMCYEDAVLSRTSKEERVLTWGRKYFGTTQRVRDIRNKISDLMDMFLDAVVSANP